MLATIQRTRASPRRLEIVHLLGAAGPKVTVSLGRAVYCDAADSPDSLVALADRALYEAKEGGRDRLVLR